MWQVVPQLPEFETTCPRGASIEFVTTHVLYVPTHLCQYCDIPGICILSHDYVTIMCILLKVRYSLLGIEASIRMRRVLFKAKIISVGWPYEDILLGWKGTPLPCDAFLWPLGSLRHI